MSDVWFTSDSHFDQPFIAGLRGFATAEEHDEHVVEEWNKVVRPVDTVWHLGDVCVGGPDRFGPYVEQLNGTIHLIPGNHCKVHPMHRDSGTKQRAWLEYFNSIQPFARRRIGGQDVMLSHFPYVGEGKRNQPDRHTQYRLPNEGRPLIHGHTHDTDQRLSFHKATPMVHVGWDAWRRPVSLDEVATLLAGAR